MPVTCKQIAEMVGVSRPAAASVLNHAKVCRVSQEKREKILKLAEELHYVSSNVARTLVRGRSDTIGILTGGLHVYRVYQNLIMLDGALREAGLLPVIVYTRSEYDAIAAGIRSLVRQGVDALLLLGVPPSVMGPLCEQKLYKMIPTVFLDLDRIPDNEQINYVNFDYRAAGDEMMRYYRSQSVHRVHAFFYDKLEAWQTRGQTEILRMEKKRGITFTWSYNTHRFNALHPEKMVDSMYEDVFEELRTMEPPDLLIFEDTNCALAALPVLVERGWKIPEQVKLFSFTAGKPQNSCLPISCLRLDYHEFARRVVEVLGKITGGSGEPPVCVKVPARFVPREKCVSTEMIQ